MAERKITRLKLEDVNEADLRWILHLDSTTDFMLSPEEILDEVKETSMQLWRLQNGPEGIMLTRILESKKKCLLEVVALAGNKAMNYMQGLVDDLFELAKHEGCKQILYSAQNKKFGELISKRCGAEVDAVTYVWRV